MVVRVSQEYLVMQSMRNQLVIMQTLSQLLPVNNTAQGWIMSESKRTTELLDRLVSPVEVGGIAA
jgi:hypothetical protein